MKMTLCALAFCVLMLPSFASAQDSIQGQWAGEIQSVNGPQQVQMAIRVDADRISGSIISDGNELSIQEASIEDNVVKFSTTLRPGDAESKLLWSGTIANGEIAFTCKAEGNDSAAFDLLVRRQAQ